jgi:hypothetical protein
MGEVDHSAPVAAVPRPDGSISREAAKDAKFRIHSFLLRPLRSQREGRNRRGTVPFPEGGLSPFLGEELAQSATTKSSPS